MESLEERRVLDSTVVFNEVMYNPAGPDDNGMEWIELYNQLVVDIDISDWELTGGVDFKFPDQTVVPGRGYLLVAADPTTFEAATGRQALGPWNGQLSNAGETLRLYNNDERLMNVLEYGDDGDWPTGADGTGLSLSKSVRAGATDDARNWTHSLEFGGTPGQPNFIEPGEFLITPLLTSPAPVRAIVPTNGDLGLMWTAPDFDDSSWLSGTGGVGFDDRDDYDPLLGLDFDAPPDGQAPSPMKEVNSSAYLRFEFDLDEESLGIETMALGARYDDGFVAYLNGVEVAWANAPGHDGNDGELTWDAASDGGNSDRFAVNFEQFSFSVPEGILQAGTNVLAVHALNRSLGDGDALFDFELSGKTAVAPAGTDPLLITEVAPAEDNAFFLEILNRGLEPVNLGAYQIQAPGSNIANLTLPAEILQAGERTIVTAGQLGRSPERGTDLILVNADGLAIDAVKVADRARGRREDLDRVWMYTSGLTPRTENVFAIEDDVVISEIMYHPLPELAIPDIQPTYDRNVVIPLTSDQWRYNATGADLASDWASQTYEADGTNWLMGQALIGYERSDLGVPINTELVRPSLNDPPFVTYYFQTSFEVTAEQIAELDRVSLSHMIDDAVAIYLNGVEIERFNLPSGPIDSQTVSETRTSNAELLGPLAVSTDLLRPGVNTISAELHLESERSSDAVFGLEVALETEATPLIPGRPYRERSELEWLELYNKGNQPIDLTGWELTDGIGYEFPAGTVLGAQQYLVLAKDAAAFSAVYPGVPVLGGFSGSLSDHDDLLRLWDRNGNVADQVHYFEGGRWPTSGDGGGSSIELIDVNADNNRGESWAASDERDKAGWTTHTFQAESQIDVSNRRATFNEFIFGLLSDGEFLIDDIEVLMDPNGEAKSMLQNGSFDSDTLGSAPEKWRLIGNHSGVVVTDPTDPTNQVLHVTATGAQAHVHDHAETTFIDDQDIEDGQVYSISFRAKWLTGNRQLNSRLWFNRIPNTAFLEVPDALGTPGAANSTQVDNAGPSYRDFGHSPTLPSPTEEVQVTVRPEDAQGIQSVVLHWREDGNAWQQVEMADDGTGLYTGTIPPHSSGKVIQFYVAAVDQQGGRSMFPAAGPDSRALYQVNDNEGPTTRIDSFRLVIMDDDRRALFDAVNRMSNWFLPMTLVHNQQSYYDVDVRQTGSRWIRPNSGYKVRLNPDQPLYGVHDSVRFDLNGMAEIVMKQMLNRAGGTKASNYDDLGFLISPNTSHSHEVIVQMARYESIYLDEQFENGSDGTKWELDDVTMPSSPRGGVEGLKADTTVYEQADIGVNRSMVQKQGANPEFYRAHLLIKSNRERDDFAAIARLAQAIHQDGDALFEASNEVMDVDLWMRHYANQAYFGNWDTYGFRRPKNLRMYLRPEDDKFVPLFWDCDLCNFTENIKTRSENTSRLDEIRDIPHNLRLFWGHMLDYVNRSFNEEYVSVWAAHYGELVENRTHGGDETFTGIARSTANRNVTMMRDLERDIPRVEFSITTNDGQPLVVDTPTVMLEGKGWVDVRQIRLAGSEIPLDVYWPEADTWQIEIPVDATTEEVALEAIDYEGNLISTDQIMVSSSAVNPILGGLRITEVQYHPAVPSASEFGAGFNDADDFEYIELTNVGGATLSLDTVRLVRLTTDNGEQGVDFDFAQASIKTLGPGESLVVVEDTDAFAERYGTAVPVAGQWSGGLGNDSEQLTLVTGGFTIQQFTYDDNWYPETDGTGRSLQILDATAARDMWQTAAGWRPSRIGLGTPGTSEPKPGDLNQDGFFNSTDLLTALGAGEYEDGIPGNSTLEEGDFDGDGDFTTRDLIWAFQFSQYEGDAPAASIPVELAAAQVSRRDADQRGTLLSDANLSPREGLQPTGFGSRDRRLYLLPVQEIDSIFAASDRERGGSRHDVDQTFEEPEFLDEALESKRFSLLS